MKDDAMLLEEYARARSEPAFAELVRRHVDFVFAAALRQVNGDEHLAHDVTQMVFVDLARKAGSLARPVLAGWLFTSTRYAAAKCVRSEQRRRSREQEAQRMNDNDDQPSAAPDWDRVRPLLDEALANLGEADRTAILLRYLQNLSFDQVGTRLAVSENAARMRTERALDKLRVLLARRGVTSSTGALALMLAGQAAVAAPAGLATAITGPALAGATAGGGILTFMSTAKLQWGLASAMVAAGAGTGWVLERERRQLAAELARPAEFARPDDAVRSENRAFVAAARAAQAEHVTDADWVRLRDEVVGLQDEIQKREADARQAQAETRERARRAAFPLNQLDTAPRITIQKTPRYPAALLQAEVAGSVLVEMVIDSSGRITESHIVRSTHKEFEVPTLEALAEWRFTPGLKGERQVATRVQQLFQYEPRELPLPEPETWF